MESKKPVSFYVKHDAKPQTAKSSRKTDDAKKGMTDEEWIQKYDSTIPEDFKHAKWYKGDFGPALPVGVLNRRSEANLRPLMDADCGGGGSGSALPPQTTDKNQS